MGEGRPVLRVTRGRPRADELAALTAVLLALRAAGNTRRPDGPPPAPPGGWRRTREYRAPDSWR
ncbi:acyl-CoA carboxylase epsilon subunit [Streptomyces sp. NPDC048182]|uniref:acyl-CoA carboxylase epsilon subunit n=1 Tax=unclassified Streptomyces TaxID=2593676 RepID=UPI0033A7BC3D